MATQAKAPPFAPALLARSVVKEEVGPGLPPLFVVLALRSRILRSAFFVVPVRSVAFVYPARTSRLVGLVLQLRRGRRVVAVKGLVQEAVLEDLSVVVRHLLVRGPRDPLAEILIDLFGVHAHYLVGRLLSVDLGDEEAVLV